LLRETLFSWFEKARFGELFCSGNRFYGTLLSLLGVNAAAAPLEN